MNIDLQSVPVRDLVKGYENLGYDGVVGYDGALDIRPKFQREFVYKGAQQQAVIETVLKKYPLNVMYWSLQKDSETGAASYEMLDGQQRSMSICEFVAGEYSVIIDGNPKNFDNLSEDAQNKILDYELMVYFCTGTEDEKLRWFEVINIAGLRLTPQELRNAVYTGPWLTSAKRYFSRENQGAPKLAKEYVRAGEVDRQELLEKAISWVAGKGDADIKAYMNEHRLDANANALWTYFKSVIDWAKLTFPYVRSEMRSVPWNTLFDVYGQVTLNVDALEDKVNRLMSDDEVEKKSGVYEFVLVGDYRALGLRTFNDNQRREAFEIQKGICPMCGDHFTLDRMHADHIQPWSKGGKTVSENCQMLCASDNLKKSNSW